MNHAYRLVWSQAKNVWVVASEKTRGRGKSSSGRLSAVALALLPLFGQASPLGGMVTSGIGAINQSGNLTTITQNSSRLSVNWKSFNIGSQQTVNFLQPSASAIAVNRIYDTNGTTILGHLNANGQIYLINPNGILFGQGAQVNVGGLVASTLDSISNNGSSVTFSGNGTGKIINEGTIAGHYVALIGNSVSNIGVISANLGSAALGAGSSVSLTFFGNDLVHMQVDKGVLNALVANGGIIQADGGYLIMTAGAKDELLSSVVNNTGIIRAETVQNKNGNIVLLGGMTSGTVNVGGTIDASAPQGGAGGAIETSAAHVEVANSAKITTLSSSGLTGSWLIDPNDFTVAASGGDITGAALSTALGSGAVTIQTTSGTASCTGVTCTSTGTSGNGDIFVNDTVTWSANTLTLNAYRDIAINSTLNGSATAGLALKYGQGATNGVIGGVTSSYSVNAPVNLASTGSFSTQLGSGGSVVNYTIITALGSAGSTTTTDLQGINGGLSGNYVLGSNIDASATSSWNTGAGFNPVGNNSTNFSGTFDGLSHTITNLYINLGSTTNVGLFGFVGSNGTVRNVGLTGGSETGASYVGALVGYNSGTISNSYSTGAASGGGRVGGLVGDNEGTISDSYSTGSVSSTGSFVGALVGFNFLGTISDSYSTGAVSGGSDVGGLVGYNSGTISNSYSTGAASGGGRVGGLVGYNHGGTISNSFWDTSTSGQATSAGGTGLTTTQMQTASSFSGFTFTTTPGATGNNWVMVDADGSLNNAGGALGATFPMLASEYSTTISNAHQLQLMAMNLSGTYTLGQNIDASNTATAATLKDVWSTTGGFVPIGNNTTNFTGTFDGLNHTISNLYISRSISNYVGLFGFVGSNGTVRDVGLVGGSVKGSTYVGTLVGDNAGAISNAYATGSLYGASTFLGEAGGLAGVNTGAISNAYATGNVSASGYFVGGLVGVSNGTISNAYATGSVSSLKSKVGGLVGNSGGPISNAYATGNVSGATYVGGLVGNNNFSTISNSYATGSVTGSSKVGGLVGGSNSGTVSNSFWNTTTSGQATSAGGAGLTTTQMQTQANFTSATAANGNVNPNWDFTTTPIWGFKSGANNGYPVLCAFYTCFVTTDVYVRLNSGLSSTYGNSPATFTWGYYTTSSGTTTVSVSPSGTPTWSNPISSTTGAGTYSETYSSGLSLTNYSFLAGSSVNYTVNATLPITSASSGQNSGTTGSTIAQIDSNFSHLSSQPLNLNPSTTITSSTTPLQPAASTGGTSSGSGSGGDSSGPGVIGNTSLSISGNGTLNIEHGGVKLPGNILSSNDGSNAQAN